MIATKKLDIVINVLLPLFLGTLIYVLSTDADIVSFVKNYVPDGLWAYALISAVLIIWERRIDPFWVTTIFVLAAVFEFAQYIGLVGGTADAIDVLVYFTCFLIGISLNRYFKTNLKNQNLEK
jgi:predicted Na+-dependent transporter